MKKTILILFALLLALTLCACGSHEEPERFAFGVVSGGDGGNAYSSSPHGYYDAGAEITAHAVPSDGSAFFCWTAGASLAEGGSFVSYEKDLTFPLEADLWLYPNFRALDAAHILYHANGGTALTSEDGTDTLWDEFSLDYYLYPNSLPDMGYFSRPGCTLIGYSTEPDGSGAFYSVGGKVFEDTDAVIELWCVWAEQSPAGDFTFVPNDSYGGWTVEAYLGSDAEVAVPDAIDGQPVVGIAEGAFAGNGAVESLILPPSLRVIADGSCSGMANLSRLVVFDSLDYVSDASFAEDPVLDTVLIGAATNPRYSNMFNNHTKKIELMNYWKDADRPMMVILGGSSTAYAVDAQQLESLLDRDCVVLNIGTNGANIFTMTSEWAMRFMEEGDFLLQIIEYGVWQMGGAECNWETFRSFEGCYNVFSWVPISQFELFFDSFCEFLDARRTMPEQSYEDYVSSMAGAVGYYDDHGTLTVVTAPNGDDSFWQGRTIYLAGNYLYSYMVDRLNQQYAKLADMGVGCALAFTPLNRNALDEKQTEDGFTAFRQYLSDKLNVDILGDVRDVIMDPAVFYDDDYHLASPARAEYTALLAEELNEYFTSAGE